MQLYRYIISLQYMYKNMPLDVIQCYKKVLNTIEAMDLRIIKRNIS